MQRSIVSALSSVILLSSNLTFAATAGLAIAQYNLGSLYLQGGPGLKADANRARAFTLAHSAATAGNTLAAFNLAKFYRQGVGCTIDLTASRQWLSRAAKQGYAPAARDLARSRQ